MVSLTITTTITIYSCQRHYWKNTCALQIILLFLLFGVAMYIRRQQFIPWAKHFKRRVLKISITGYKTLLFSYCFYLLFDVCKCTSLQQTRQCNQVQDPQYNTTLEPAWQQKLRREPLVTYYAYKPSFLQLTMKLVLLFYWKEQGLRLVDWTLTKQSRFKPWPSSLHYTSRSQPGLSFSKANNANPGRP